MAALTTKKTEYCKCGASISLMGTSKQALSKAIALWREEHVGDGHGPATRQVAYMARIRSDQRTARQRVEVMSGSSPDWSGDDPFPEAQDETVSQALP